MRQHTSELLVNVRGGGETPMVSKAQLDQLEIRRVESSMTDSILLYGSMNGFIADLVSTSICRTTLLAVP